MVAYSLPGPSPTPDVTNILASHGFDIKACPPLGDVLILGYDGRSGHARSLTFDQMRCFTTKVVM
jgi:hypothetical protein